MKKRYGFFDKHGANMSIPCTSFDVAMNIARNRRNIGRIEEHINDSRVIERIWDITLDLNTGRSTKITQRSNENV